MTVIRAFTEFTQTRFASRWIATVGALAVLFVVAASASAAGLSVSDENIKLKVGGRAHFDLNFLSADDDAKGTMVDGEPMGDPADGVEFRRLRYYMSGELYGIIDFKFQLDFAGGSASFKDAYMSLKNTPLGGAALTVGQFYQPFGLETQTSSNYMSFIERDQMTELHPDRQSGLMLSRSVGDDQGSVAVSTFRKSNSQGKSVGDANWNVAGRVTFLPMGDNTQKGLLHLGGAFALRDDASGKVSVEGAAPSNFSPAINGGDLPFDSWTEFGGEAAFVKGPFSVQGELTMLQTTAPEDTPGAEDQSVMSYYGMASYFLTGESRAYKAASGTFNRVSPKENYDGQGGKGAVELVARFSVLDMTDSSLAMGKNTAMTFGINWYLNKHSRVMINAMRSEGSDTMGGIDGVVNAIVTRFQVDY
jgi:phosphate-selective porin OprO/OprP